jgi:hypothetical protein
MASDIEKSHWPSTPDEPSARLCNFPTGGSALRPAHRDWLARNIVPILQGRMNAKISACLRSLRRHALRRRGIQYSQMLLLGRSVRPHESSVVTGSAAFAGDDAEG